MPYTAPGFLWQAPATAVYTFTGTCSYDDIDHITATTDTNQVDSAYVIVGRGTTCDGADFPTCSSPGLPQPFRIALNAGDEVVVAVTDMWAASSPDIEITRSDFSVDITSCVPDCSGRTCGDDGCGGTCGSCGDNEQCQNGACVCVPNCYDRDCGGDGCGGTCGSCAADETCNGSGWCVCTPQCDGRSCGDDGCGGSCGTCVLGEHCSNGACLTNACDPLLNDDCTAPNSCLLLSNEEPTCALAGSGTQNSACNTTADCAGGYACFGGACHLICVLATGHPCPSSSTCAAVSGWTQYGACD